MVLMFNKRYSRIIAAASTLAFTLGLSACSDSTGSSGDSSSKHDGKVKVATSFYPIQWLTEQIGGDNVEVTSVTPAGTEPHDYEISTKQIAELNKTNALFYVKGFQPSLDDAVGSLDNVTTVDLTKNVNLVHHDGLIEDDDHDHGATKKTTKKMKRTTRKATTTTASTTMIMATTKTATTITTQRIPISGSIPAA